MKNTDYFRYKKITIVGLARSGMASAELLCDLGARVSISDNHDNPALRLNAAKLKSQGISIELGRHTKEFIAGRDLVVISPGVPASASPIIWAKECQIPALSEIEVGWLLCPAPIIAVTGSNGKSTVTTLIGRLIEASGKRALVCGNIGNPFCGELSNISQGDWVCLEVSSFQLENIRDFRPQIGLMLNFSHNHLDRYKDMDEYLAAKKHIFINQDKNDYLILNQNDRVLRQLARQTKSRVVFFSGDNQVNPNQAALLAVASVLGIDQGIAAAVFRDFRGLEHRLEEVGELNRVRFINDSKATTPDACIWALKNIRQPVVLIAGGKDKGSDYRLVLAAARDRVKAAVLFGQAKEKIAQAFSGILNFQDAASLEEAVQKAFQKASAGDCVLLSPMCSSFDMFSDYEERGRVFKQIVNDLINVKRFEF